jgi:hypothetical protein
MRKQKDNYQIKLYLSHAAMTTGIPYSEMLTYSSYLTHWKEFTKNKAN